MFAAVALVVLLSGSSCGTKPSHEQAKPGREFTVSASTTGSFSRGLSWAFKGSSRYGAMLTIDGQVTEVMVDPLQFEELRSLVHAARFFDLDSEYGERVWDGSTKVLSISDGEETNTVTWYFLMNWVHNSPSKLEDPARAVEVMMLVRSWFDHPDAVDLRKYNQVVLDAVQ